MMATIRTPSTAGGSIAAFLDNYYRAQQNARADESLARQSRLASAQEEHLAQEMAVRQRRMEQEGALTGAIAALPGLVNPPAPGPIATPGVNIGAETMGDVGGVMQIPPAGAVIPELSQPPVTGTPISQVTAGLSPEQQTALIATPGGQAALKAHGVIPDADFSARQRQRTATVEAERRAKASEEALMRGDVLGHYAEARAGLAALAGAATTPEAQARYQQALTHLGTERQKWLTKKTEKEADFKAYSADLQSISSAAFAYRQNPTPETSASLHAAISAAKSPEGQKFSVTVLKDAVASALKSGDNPGVRVMALADAVLAKQADERGTTKHTRDDLVNAYRQVKTQRPADWASAYWGLALKGKVPAEWQLAQWGRVEVTNDYQAATETAFSQGHQAGTKEFDVAYNAALDARKKANRSTTSSLGANITAELRAAGVDPEKATPEDIRRAIEAADKRRQGLPAGVNAELAAAGVDPRQATPEDVRAALERIEAKRKARGKELETDWALRLGREKAEGKKGKTAPAAVAPATGPPAPTAKPAERANPPKPGPTKADAVAELRRLMAAGHTKQSAAETMRQAGWK